MGKMHMVLGSLTLARYEELGTYISDCSEIAFDERELGLLDKTGRLVFGKKVVLVVHGEPSKFRVKCKLDKKIGDDAWYVYIPEQDDHLYLSCAELERFGVEQTKGKLFWIEVKNG